jgi:mono/diheme cytochrome c family protein
MGRRAQAAAGVLVCAGLVVAALFYARLSSYADLTLLAWNDAAVVARGQALYAARCAACHGIDGEGQSAASNPDSSAPLAPPHDASGHTWRHPDFALVQLTKSGASAVTCLELDENAMPRFEQTLTDRDVIDVLSYIKSTWPAEIRAEQDAVNRLYGSQNAAVRDLLDLKDG